LKQNAIDLARLACSKEDENKIKIDTVSLSHLRPFCYTSWHYKML